LGKFTGPGAPPLDFVFTVCDRAVREACPTLPGKPVTDHWGVEDPAAVNGTDEHKRAAFRETSRLLKARIELFLATPRDLMTLMSSESILGRLWREQMEKNKPPLAKVYNVLFICTGNSARSIIAESVLNRLGRGRFKAYSAGSQPAGHVNPFALDLLQRQKLPIEGLRSKSWKEFAAPGAPDLDFVFTVCDRAAGESCPVWPGQPMTAHWGVEDPAAATGSDEQKQKAFQVAMLALSRRIELFLSLPLEKLDRLSLQSKLSEIGKS
jgi:protein-tyrosine-phosphatase